MLSFGALLSVILSSEARYVGDVHEIHGANGAQRRLAVENEYVLMFTDKTAEECDALRKEVTAICKKVIERNSGGVGAFNAVEATKTPLLSKCFITMVGPEECTKEVREEIPEEFSVEPNFIVHSLANPPSWGLNRIDQPNLPLTNGVEYQTAYTGAGVNVYVVDTGIWNTHNDFGGRAEIGGDFVNENDRRDQNGHGTHCAGTVGGTTYGVAPEARIFGVKVLSASGGGTLSGVISGIEWSVQKQASDFNGEAGVISMSLGGGSSSALDGAATEAATNGNMIVVVAAGNENQDACNVSPAGAGGNGPSGDVITVASSTSSDARSSFSNYGSCVDIFAPGSSITSSWIGSNSASNTISGTSMATPHVAGLAATMLQKHNKNRMAAVSNLFSLAVSGKISDVKGTPNLLLQSETYTGPPTLPPPPTPKPTPQPTHSEQRICIDNQSFCANYQSSEFGPGMPDDFVYSAPLVVAEEDPILCTDPSAEEAARFAGKIVIVSRGECLFFDKVKRAENAGAVAVIIHMSDDQEPFPPGYFGDDTTALYSAMISLQDGQTFKSKAGSMVVIGSDTAMGPPTFSPTKSPTGPTVPPTFAPTLSPTLPTAFPTRSPTLQPTLRPTSPPKSCARFNRRVCQRNKDQCVWGRFPGSSRARCLHKDDTPPPTAAPTWEEDEDCPSGDWESANDYCEAKGQSLCSVRDLLTAAPQDDACFFDATFVWTGQRCRRGRFWAVMRDRKRRRCMPSGQEAAYRCC